MWFLPSYGRPERLRELLNAPGGWPDEVIVLVNYDDPLRSAYSIGARDNLRWQIRFLPEESRCADAHRFISTTWPDDNFYGLLCDDQWPVSPGWWKAMEEAAGDRFIAVPNGEPNFPLIRNAVCFGGDLVRAMGSLVPAQVKHNYEDNIWDRIASDFNLLEPLKDVYVRHRHWIRGEAKKDATYERGSADIDKDKAIFEQWLNSQDRVAMNKRIGDLLGIAVSTFDPRAIRLSVVVSMYNFDIAYHKSINATLMELPKIGISVNLIESLGGSDVGKARERLLWDALSYKPTHLMWIDADMGWNPPQIVRLLSADHEFACVVGVKKTDELKLCANFYEKQEFHPHTQFLKIKDVGFAFVLMKVSVIDKMCKAYPELRYNAGDREEYALFLQMIDKLDTAAGPYGERLSEDFSFCRRWTTIGGDIWCEPDASIIHAGRKEYTGKVSDLFTYDAAPKSAA